MLIDCTLPHDALTMPIRTALHRSSFPPCNPRLTHLSAFEPRGCGARAMKDNSICIKAPLGHCYDYTSTLEEGDELQRPSTTWNDP